MTKKPFMEDIHPPHKRSIRDIPLIEESIVEKPRKKSSTRQASTVKKVTHKQEVAAVLSEDAPIFSDFSDLYTQESSPLRWGKISVWVIVLVVLVGGGLFTTSFFYSAVVGVKVKEVTTSIDSEIKLSRTAGAGILPFEIVSLSKEVSQAVPAQSEKQVSTKASGKILIYNKNSISQKLLAQTRLESPQGKIYKTVATVVVPAAKKVGSAVVPGSIEVSALADASGQDFNISLTDFTIPGFKGTAKYQAIYGRSKTPFIGGMLGTVKVADPQDVSKAGDALKEDLKKQLLESVNQQKPEAFILFADLYSIQYASTTEESKDDSVILKQKADFVGVLVNSQTLSNFLASKSIRGYSGEDVSVSNLSELITKPSVDPSNLKADTTQISIDVTGKPHFVYIYDVAKLKKDLSGMARESFPTILATYLGIEKGDVKIGPFWRATFPEDVSKITINEE